MKISYRQIYLFDIEDEINEGKNVRILDRLLEKVYKPEEMSAMDYIRVVASRDHDRYDCWVVEATPVEDNIEEVLKYVND